MSWCLEDNRTILILGYLSCDWHKLSRIFWSSRSWLWHRSSSITRHWLWQRITGMDIHSVIESFAEAWVAANTQTPLTEAAAASITSDQVAQSLGECLLYLSLLVLSCHSSWRYTCSVSGSILVLNRQHILLSDSLLVFTVKEVSNRLSIDWLMKDKIQVMIQSVRQVFLNLHEIALFSSLCWCPWFFEYLLSRDACCASILFCHRQEIPSDDIRV